MRSLSFALILSLGLGSQARAQETEAPQGDERPPEITLVEEAPPESGFDRVVVNTGVTAVSQYISRGVSFSDRPSLQPFVSVRVTLPEAEGGIVTGASVFVGNWNSIQGGAPGLGQANDGAIPGWYEADVYAGAAVELNNRWTVSATYYRYISPAGSFPGYNDFELIVRFDDASLWDRIVPLPGFRLSPALRVVQEAGQPNRDDGLYVQPSLTAGFALGSSDNPVRLSVPLVLGFSDSFYRGRRGGNPSYGFLRTGVAVSGAPFPRTAGALSVNGGVDVWLPNDRVASGLGGTELVGRVGASWSF